MQWLAEICVRRPVFATVLTLLIVVLGINGYGRLGLDRFPQIDFPVVTVVTVLPGASPEDVETQVTDPIEAAINTIGDIEELRSISAEGVSMVITQFKLEKDVDVAAQDVRDRVNRILRDLPADIETPAVNKIDPDASPILFAALRAPGRPVREVTALAEGRLREALEILPGVGQVRTLGGQGRVLQVWLDPVRMRALGVGAAEVARALSTQNLSLPGGRVDTGRDQLTLRIHGRVQQPEEVALLPVRTMGDRVIRVKDLARVEDGAEEAESSALWNGEPAVVLAIRKQTGANTVAVADAVAERIAELQSELPLGYELEIIRDESGTIRTGTNSVKEHLVVGALLAALVVLAFLGSLRSTLIAAIAIPTSVLGTFGVMAALGYTLNTITLLALALCVGIVIDDAIVVLENIFRHVEEKGQDPKVAAVNGTREIGLAVMATTLSLIAVFLPVVFLAGIPGRFLRSFGVTMSVAIAVSLFVSFTLTPMLASRWLKAHPPGEKVTRTPLEQLSDRFYRPIEQLYLVILAFCMRRRWVVVLACAMSLGLLPPLGIIAKKGFLPVDDQAQFEVSVRAPEGQSLVSTTLVAERIAREIRGLDGVVGTLVTVGASDQGTDNVATIYTRLNDPRDRPLSQEAIKDLVRKEILADQPAELRVSVGDVAAFGGMGASTARVQYNISGPDLVKLEEIANAAVSKLRKEPAAVDVDSSLVVGRPEIGVFVDRARAADLGVSVMDVATALQLFVGGAKVSTYEEQGEQYEIRLRAAGEYRNNPEVLGLLPVPSTRGGTVSLRDVVRIETGSGPASINRLGRERVVTVVANPAPGYGDSQVGDALLRILDDLDLPAAYQARPSGQAKLMKQTGESVIVGFSLAFVFMYLVLAAQFESWLHPFTILLTLPLTLPFALLSIVLTGQALDMFSVLGIFVLFGIVKKNAILQIDHTNQLREQGMPRLEAIIQANRDRLRPILMTTVAFVAGMIPLVTSEGIGAGLNRATSGVVVGGQVLSLLLTLLAAPVFYSIFDDILEYLRQGLRQVGLQSPAKER